LPTWFLLILDGGKHIFERDDLNPATEAQTVILDKILKDGKLLVLITFLAMCIT